LATGIVSGLFFQPRSIWLKPAEDGACSFTGVEGRRVALSPFLPKSELSKKPTKGEDVWTHPCAPLAVNSQGIGAIRLNAERPAWTGLAQLLDPVSRDRTKAAHPLEGPAPVVSQWRALAFRGERLRLLVLDFDRDKANVKRRFFEAFPLTADLGSRETVDLIRALVVETQRIAGELDKALTRAHDDRKAGGFALADARASFWGGTEAHFVDWLNVVTKVDRDTDAGEARFQSAAEEVVIALKRKAKSIFDTHVEPSEFDPRKQERIAKQRRALQIALYQKTAGASPKPSMEART
jgi:hypothetical protein